MDYLLVDNHENSGLRYYMHKYHVGLHTYYLAQHHEQLIKEKMDDIEKKSPKEYLTMQ
jgi:hypothetical protein